MQPYSLRAIRHAMANGDVKHALALADQAIEAGNDCPYILVLRGVLIQLQDRECHHPLAQAEADFLAAYEIDSAFMPALEELANYYDAVSPDSDKARAKAREYLQRVQESVEQMRRIAGSD